MYALKMLNRFHCMNRLELDLVNSAMVLVNKFYTMFRKYRK